MLSYLFNTSRTLFESNILPNQVLYWRISKNVTVLLKMYTMNILYIIFTCDQNTMSKPLPWLYELLIGFLIGEIGF